VKRATSIALFFILCVSVGWAQSFELPPVSNDVESVKIGFEELLRNFSGIGFIDYDSSWANNPIRYQNYLDAVLNNMAYAQVKAYVEKLDASIQGIDYGSLSRRQQADFESFMAKANVYSLYTNFEIDRRYDSPERQEQKLLLQPLWESLKNLQTWVLFFQNENTIPRDFLIGQKNKEGLSRILEEIPQRNFDSYSHQVESFCAEWGL